MKVLGLFSKVVGAQPQGTLMGWFGSAGALARTVFPVLAGWWLVLSSPNRVESNNTQCAMRKYLLVESHSAESAFQDTINTAA